MGLTLADLARERARTRGDHVAITFDGRDLTYRDLDTRANRVANGLLAAGIGRGDRVAFLEKNVPEFFELAFGAAKIGAVIVPVNWRLAPAEMRDIIVDAHTRLLLTGPDLESAVAKIESELAGVETILFISDDGPYPPFAAWRDAHIEEDPHATISSSDVAVQFYTSGTTGLPKGAMLTHDNVFAPYPALSEFLRMSDRSVSLVTMPLYHIAGTGWSLFGMWLGAHNIMLREVDPAVILETIPRYGVTHTVFVPAVMLFLLMAPGVEDTDFSSLEVLAYGASPISEELLRNSIERFGCDFVQLYGLTETDGGIVALPADDHDVDGPNAHRLRAAGIPIPGVRLRIVDVDGNDCTVGEVGEVWIHSPSTMAGYWNRPEATAAAITEDGWFKSGDAGYLDDDGYLYIHDRIKDMIVSGGENIYPAEVESVLMSHPAVADVAVIGVPHDRWGETVKAVVVAAPDARVTDTELIAFCRERLAHYKSPTSIDRVDTLPRNPSGKILKKDFREPYWRDSERRVH